MIRDHDVGQLTAAELEQARRTEICHMQDTWETTVRTAANTMLRYSDKISDGLEAELYALLEQLDTRTSEHGHA
jgi:hypothetical protein